MRPRFHPQFPLIRRVRGLIPFILQILSLQPHSDQQNPLSFSIVEHETEPIVVLKHIYVLVVREGLAWLRVVGNLRFFAFIVEILDVEH